jgi:uncharacterized protein (TIGR03067 family)
VDLCEVVNEPGRLTKVSWVTHVRISGDRWSLLENGRVIADYYRITVDASKSPAHVNWLPREGNRATVEYVGIVKRQGDRMRITYISGSTNRPDNFDNLPVGTYMITATK